MFFVWYLLPDNINNNVTFFLSLRNAHLIVVKAPLIILSFFFFINNLYSIVAYI